MIKIFPAITVCEPAELHEFTGLLGAFLDGQGVKWRDVESQPIAINKNGVPVPVTSWDATSISADDDVQIRVLPRGGIIKFIRKVDPLLGMLIGPTQKTNTPDATPEGARLESAQTKANTPKLNSVVPELAGRFRRYPDYLTPPRRYFIGQREQWLEFMVCIGPGSYQISAEDVKIGETSFTSLGADAQYTIYGPGADLTNLPASDIWYTAPEIGGTSSGTAGLEIPTEYTGAGDEQLATEFAFNGNQITITQPGDGHWAAGMRAGSRVTSVTLPLPYEIGRQFVEAGQTDMVNTFTGNFQEILPIAVDDPVGVSFNTQTGAVIRTMNLDAAGNGTITLKSGIGGNPLDPFPVGTQYLTFKTAGPSHYDVLSLSGKTITVRKFAGSPVQSPVINWLGFANVTSAAATVVADASSFAGDWTNPFAATPDGELARFYQLDYFFPSGLAHVNDEGGVESRTVQFELSYRDKRNGPAGAWTTIPKTFTAATLDAIGFTEGVDTGVAIEAEFRQRRLGIGSAESNDYEDCVWYGMRAFMMVKTSYPELTTMFVRIRSGGKVAAATENQISVIATRILPIIQFDGSFGVDQPTRDITAFVRYIARTVGYEDSELDTGEMLRLHNIWTSRGDVFDYVFDETTVRDAINKVLYVGMAEMTVDDGLIKPVRDEPRSQYEQSYSPQNTVGFIRRDFKARRRDDFDGVEVEFTNADTWAQETVKCMLPGDAGFKLQKIKIDGATNRTRAWRIGMRERRKLVARNWNYSWSTELDALNSGYLSYVALIDDIPGYGKSAILQAISSYNGLALMTVSEPLTWEAGQDHFIYYRRPDGTVAGPFAATPGPSEYHVLANVPTPWPVVTLKMEPPHIYFGVGGRTTFPALITDIKPNGSNGAAVMAVNYADIYQDDNNAPA